MARRHLTLIATTGDRFCDFAPYVPAASDDGTVAFQAALAGGGTGVFTGSGEAVDEAAGPSLVRVTSHPDRNGVGMMSFYGDRQDGGRGVFLLHDARLETVADTSVEFSAIGPLGPTMNDAGTVAFRADRSPGVSGIFTGDGKDVVAVVETDSRWRRFHGLPVITRSGALVFRADRADNVQGIYCHYEGSIGTVAESGDFFETLSLFPSANDDGTVAFAATLRAGGAGIFTAAEGGITRIADTGGAFEAYRAALITDGGNVVVLATPRGGSLGLFDGADPVEDRILAVGDQFLGSNVAELASNPVSVNAVGQVAIRVTLTDGRQLILRADPHGYD